jgi:hypothetical protein
MSERKLEATKGAKPGTDAPRGNTVLSFREYKRKRQDEPDAMRFRFAVMHLSANLALSESTFEKMFKASGLPMPLDLMRKG